MDSLARSLQSGSAADMLVRIVDDTGSAVHGHVAPAIMRSADAFVCRPADLADAVHHLAMLHGQMPGVVDLAGNHVTQREARAWLLKATTAFGRERSYLGRLVVAVGPVPSTAGQPAVTGILTQQRRAIEMLARSDRRGTALGAAMALILDWTAVRAVLDGGAARLGIDPPATALPDRAETLAMLAAIETYEPIGRAVQFGASQLLGQHWGLWDLLRDRAALRG